MNDLLMLYRLQEIDLDIARRKSKLQELEGKIGETEEMISARSEVEEAEQILGDARKRSKEIEDKIASIRAKAKTTEEKLYSGKVKNPREVESLQELLSSLKKHRSELEDSLLELMMSMEEWEARLKERKERWDVLRSAWEESQGSLNEAIEEAKTELSDLEQRRIRLRSSISASLLEEYDYLARRKGGMAIAKVVNGTCGVCGTVLPPALLSRLRRGELVHCGGCGRLLILP